MEFEHLESYDLFSDISDDLLLITEMIKIHKEDLIINDIFKISKNSNLVTLLPDKDESDKKRTVDWLIEKKLMLNINIDKCTKLTYELFKTHKGENISVNTEVKVRITNLNKIKRKLENIELFPIEYFNYLSVKNDLSFISDISGIIVKKTKYYLI